ncbi:heavy-metal-associated domain-containing protein [bacterium SCSIO 12643]|nr:heavy-metal-associated domain-containing protein [bacterium SCSIO 12643]
MKNLKTIAFMATAMWCIFPEIGMSQTQEKTEVSNKIVQKTYRLQGFKQSCCSGIINFSLEEVEGYIKLKHQQVTVFYDESKCTEEQIKAAINQTPYKILEEVE